LPLPPASPPLDARRRSTPLPLATQVRVRDGRVLVGEFSCLDAQGNVILANTHEVMMLGGR
jgi:hypothetical protein